MQGSKRAAVVALLALAAIAAACGSDNNNTSSSGTPAGSAATGVAQGNTGGQPSGKQELRLNLGGEPDTLDPSRASFSAEIGVVIQLWRGLLTFDKDLNLVPDLAVAMPSKENGGISADGMTYTFKIKPGQVFSDGVPVTSKHFAYALKRAVTPGQSGDYATFYTGIKGANAVAKLKPDDAGLKAAQEAMGVQTPDDSTLVVQLDKPNAVFLQFMALWPSFPLREDLIAKNGDTWTDPGKLVGNGPFLLKEWQHKDHITLVRNDKYSGPDKPRLDSVVLKMIEDRNQAYNAYLTGELDQVAIPSELTKVVENDPRLKSENVKVVRLATAAIAMNNAAAPFDNMKVRQAFAMAFDRDALVASVYQGVNRPAYSWLPPGMPGYDAELGKNFKLDPAKAKQLLADAGFAGGKGLPKMVLTYANTGNNPPVAEFLKEQFSKNLGVSIELEPVDTKTLQTRFKANDFQLVFVGWNADYPDPENFLYSNFHSGAGNNKSNYSNKQFDDLLDRAQVETDSAKRLDLYKQAHQILVNDMPVAFTIYSEFNNLRKPYVKDLFNTGIDSGFSGSRFLSTAFVQR
jgi:oligopeptide transport system substrate-binding protein